MVAKIRPRWSILRAGAVLAFATASLVLTALPAVTGVLARELGLSARVLGPFASANALGAVLGSALAVLLMRAISPRATATLGLALLLCANVGSVAIGLGGALVALRALGGLGTGLTLSACYYVFTLSDQERNIAASAVAQTGLAFVVITAMPFVVDSLGWRGMFAVFGAMVIPCLLLARLFPDSYTDDASAMPETGERRRFLEWIGLVSVFCAALSALSMWGYLERIGASSGISPEHITTALSVCTVFGFISSAIVLFLGPQVTRPASLIVCSILFTFGVIASASPDRWIYTAAICSYYFSMPIFIAAQFGAVMRRVTNKRFSAQFLLAGKMGALGPMIAGLVAERFGFASVRWLSLSLFVVSTSLLWLCFIRPLAAVSVSLTPQSPEAHPSGGSRNVT